jgi:hypothetical protein
MAALARLAHEVFLCVDMPGDGPEHRPIDGAIAQASAGWVLQAG